MHELSGDADLLFCSIDLRYIQFSLYIFKKYYLFTCILSKKNPTINTDKQNALRRECTFKIEIVLEIGVAGVNIDLNITVLTLSDVLARLVQSVRPWRMVIDFYQ